VPVPDALPLLFPLPKGLHSALHVVIGAPALCCGQATRHLAQRLLMFLPHPRHGKRHSLARSPKRRGQPFLAQPLP
jgi:hypothetical protein